MTHGGFILALLGLLAGCNFGGEERPVAQLPELVCDGELTTSDTELLQIYVAAKRETESSPFYRAAEQRLGQASACELTPQSGALQLSYRFGGEVILTAHFDPRIEYTEQRLVTTIFSDVEAVALLKATEIAVFGNDGCGIAWEHSEREELPDDSSEEIFRGEICNCQARIAYRSGQPTAIIFRKTC